MTRNKIQSLVEGLVEDASLEARIGDSLSQRDIDEWTDMFMDVLTASDRTTVTVAEGEEAVCPHCNGTGDDPDTMICVLCGGDGKMS